jgi:hypothetical protein
MSIQIAARARRRGDVANGLGVLAAQGAAWQPHGFRMASSCRIPSSRLPIALERRTVRARARLPTKPAVPRKQPFVNPSLTLPLSYHCAFMADEQSAPAATVAVDVRAPLETTRPAVGWGSALTTN